MSLGGVVVVGALAAYAYKLSRTQQSSTPAPALEEDLSVTSVTISPPDDMHLHFRDGAMLKHTVAHTAAQFQRALVMPNLQPPVVTTEQALAYRTRILSALQEAGHSGTFTPLMTLYLTDKTSPEEIIRAKQGKHIYACKLYPAGATTNSDSGVATVTSVLSFYH